MNDLADDEFRKASPTKKAVPVTRIRKFKISHE